MAKKEGLFRTGYVSELDQFLRDFDKAHPDFIPSRVREIAKFKKIFEQRDDKGSQKKD
jgi:hypothetical protein